MILHNNQVCFRVLSQTTKSWYIQYPGFSSLQSDGAEKETPSLHVGVGEIIETKSKGINIGDHVLFAGFADTKSETLTTSCNCVVKISRNGSTVPENLGIAAQMLYIVTMLKPQAGMNFYIDTDVSQKDLLKDLLFKIGCNAYFEKNAIKMFDGAIVTSNHVADIDLTENGKTIVFDGNANMNYYSLGQDFNIPFYMIDGGVIPDHFMHATTRKNLKTAYELFYDADDAQTKADAFKNDISGNNFASAFRESFEHHVTPGIMSISIRNRDVCKVRDMAVGIAKYIINSTVADRIHHKTGKSEVITLKFANGSVADCFAIESSHDSIDAEIHFDKTSLVYSDGTYQCFRGKVSEKATTLSCPAVEDIEKFIALGKD
jgi:hypothetical protein